ncbi:TlpA disulfide reductase family protein [Clostridium sp. CCUG 7971]|uniref:TlpA family protein disulfide reductase n=1 Tax=Clostridium sp. CCUG 7971 TaxID=2811414 RepID=UPI001ABA7033|nr:TlpA disulfide reductase family protein [Clostridium sp. CCUG 7971]MBO3443850.1 TlpA family protein disulfide reductase [Clostridium sp. CCUG 7971]
MNKLIKTLIRVLITIAIIFTALVVILRFLGPADVIVLTEEEEKQQKQQEIEQYKNTNLKGFKAKDLNGKEITSDIFSKYKLTMINIWNTGCGPCIEEMPEIEKLYEDLPKDTNIISICTDAGDSKKDLDFAKEIMKMTGAKFTTLIPDEFLKRNLTDDVQAFPTTIFVDSEGKAVGTPHFDEQTAKAYEKSIIDRLKLVEAK